ncbi:MAG: cytosine permease [Actinomycetota bacterium]|nr:cytosine permease [Actinomycetota bacterium]
MSVLERIERVPPWGIEPVPDDRRVFTGIDMGVLWGNLGISLLLPVVGALLVPALSFRDALAAIVVGALIGNLMLATAARIGADTGVPTMALYRAPLGMRGSYAPTIFNVLQNIGWGSFELFIMAAAAAAVSERMIGVGARPVWVILFGAISVVMAAGGPVAVVRQWIRRFAVWAVIASSAYISWYLLSSFDISASWSSAGEGGWPNFWQAVDLSVALPISWIPLVADYSRFARKGRAAFWGAGIGYFVAHVWFYMIGVLLVLGQGGDPADPEGFIGAMLAIPVGFVALLILLVDETDEAFANMYSTAVSLQNIVPRMPQRILVLLVGAICTTLALVVNLVQYENFLLLIGALFVPLFGVLAAHYYLLRDGRYDVKALYRRDGAYWYAAGVNWPLIAAWAIGFLTYNWINPGTVSWWSEWMTSLLGDWLSLPTASSWLGASLTSFVVAAGATVIAGSFRRNPRLARDRAY